MPGTNAAGLNLVRRSHSTVPLENKRFLQCFQVSSNSSWQILKTRIDRVWYALSYVAADGSTVGGDSQSRGTFYTLAAIWSQVWCLGTSGGTKE